MRRKSASRSMLATIVSARLSGGKMRQVSVARTLRLRHLTLAQRTTGDIRGAITDATGAVLPGVTVTLRGRGVPGAPTTVTNESGVYRFPNLPPGTYTSRRSSRDSRPASRPAFVVALGGTPKSMFS